MALSITFIGTGSGKVSLSRYHSSTLWEVDGKTILLDAGDSVSRALLRNGISYNDIDVLLLSHFHADHAGGIASLLTQMKLSKRCAPLKILLPPGQSEKLLSICEASFLFIDYLGFEIVIKEIFFDRNIFLTEELNCIARRNSHIRNKHKMNYPDSYFVSSSFLFEFENLFIVYSADIGRKEDLFLFDDRKANIFIAEATHITSKDIFEAYETMRPDEIILTHIDDEFISLFAEEISKYPEKKKYPIRLANDGMKISL